MECCSAFDYFLDCAGAGVRRKMPLSEKIGDCIVSSVPIDRGGTAWDHFL